MRLTVGIDVSLTGTGICWTTPPYALRGTRELSSAPAGALLEMHHRIIDMADRTCALVPHGALVCIEGPSIGSKDGQAHTRAGLWWEIVRQCYSRGCEVHSIPPAVLKKYATGKGNANKDAVIASIVRLHPDLDIQSNNVADAVALDDIAQILAGGPALARNKTAYNYVTSQYREVIGV